MKMREKAVRGKKYRLQTGEQVIALEAVDDTVRVLLSNEKIAVYPKTDLSLSTIDTKDYERVK